MTTTNPPTVKTRTFCNTYVSGYQYSSASTRTTNPLTSGQAEMQAAMLNELKDATFTVNLTARGAPLQADPDDIQKVFDHLRDNCRLTHMTLFAGDKSTKDAPRLPPSGFGAESESYDPLTHLLNTIVHAANSCLTGPRYLEALHFCPHGVEMREKIYPDTQLKPDILGLLRSPTPDEPTISWNDVAVFIEVQSQLIEAVKRLATYAHCHLAVERRRSFTIAIAICPKRLTLHFICFHRFGVSFSPPLDLDKEDGFRSVVEHMVGVLSIRDEEAFGLDMTRAKNVYRLNGRNYEMTSGVRDTPASLRSRNLTCADGVSELPEKLVYKLSYRPKGRPSEGSFLSDFRGQFGIVDIVGFCICSTDELFGCTERHLSDAVFFPLGDDKNDNADEKDFEGKTPEPEVRYLHCTAMALEGLPLLDLSDSDTNIPTPPELVETILHSIIGHYNLFIGGVLHRDVSCGNILRLQEPIERHLGHSKDLLEKILDKDVDLGQCRSILIDGDHAIEWHKGAIAPSSERSQGTLPFMSTHLLDAWDRGRKALHTAADDLESFLWVLIWSLVKIFKKLAPITDKNSRILRLEAAFSGHTFNAILRRDSITYRELAFKGLIDDWQEIGKKSETTVRDFEGRLMAASDEGDREAEIRIFNELDKHCSAVYEKFVRKRYEHLQTICVMFSSWKEVMDFNDLSLLNR